MGLKEKVARAFALNLLIFVFLFLGCSLFLGRYVLGNWERREVLQAGERAVAALEKEVAELQKSVTDWAVWDESYVFVSERNPDFVERNLVDNVFEILDLNYIAFLNAEGGVVYARGFDPRVRRDLPIPQEVLGLKPPPGEAAAGLLKTQGGPLLVACHSILRSDGSGPPRGRLVFGRILKEKDVEKISGSAGFPLSLTYANEVNLISMEPLKFSKSEEPVYFKRLSGAETSCLIPVNDIGGRTSFFLQGTLPRSAYRFLLGVYFVYGSLFVLIMAVAFGTTLNWVNCTVVRRVLTLVHSFKKMAEGPLSEVRVPVLKDDDELAFLSLEVNRLLSKLKDSQQDLADKERKCTAVIENAAEAILVVQEGSVVYTNRATAELLGYTPQELQSQPFSLLIHPEDRERVEKQVGKLLEGAGGSTKITFRVITKNGESKWAEANAAAMDWEGRPATLYFISDITSRKILEEEIERLLREKSLILDSLTELVLFLDRDMHVIWANRAAAQSVNKRPEELYGGKCYEIWHGRNTPCQGCPVVRAISTGEFCSGETTSPDGRHWSISATPVKDDSGNVVGVVETTLDITERKRYEEQLRYLSLHDPLTGLYNRAFFQEELKRLEASREYPITILVADLDGLKLINDTLGHTFGDEMLKACAQILRNCMRREDVLARIGGDEFAAILPKTDAETAARVAERVLQACQEHNQQHPELPVYLSIGHATSLTRREPLQETFVRADDLMYRHKLLHKTSVKSRIVDTLVASLEEKDFFSTGHARRMEELCLRLGQRLGLSPYQLDKLSSLARVHDLGKVIVPDHILYKEGPLDENEWELVRQHPERGYRIALSSPELSDMADLILYHHEWWNGQGYPLGQKGEEIPLESRILAIVDAFEVMTSGRPYKKAVSQAEALLELRRCAGSQFDPELVDHFIALVQN
ncbi:diguanylate cyclase domain-containing protein [Desulfovirgula thermocuniculi]|uniref:diguanylate cyclase domain-containing protein n=1 Tax=Desulfovirgula thermocuniculi TaxID=348842 RepID=UPI000411A48E|nr:HD domain-containing phosphohydrolase [Desulfovirgula thermocuniculi]